MKNIPSFETNKENKTTEIVVLETKPHPKDICTVIGKSDCEMHHRQENFANKCDTHDFLLDAELVDTLEEEEVAEAEEEEDLVLVNSDETPDLLHEDDTSTTTSHSQFEDLVELRLKFLETDTADVDTDYCHFAAMDFLDALFEFIIGHKGTATDSVDLPVGPFQDMIGMGFHMSVIRAMNIFQDELDVQILGCSCLSAYGASRSRGTFKGICAEIVASGGLDCLARTLTKFTDRFRIQVIVFGAMNNLLANTLNLQVISWVALPHTHVSFYDGKLSDEFVVFAGTSDGIDMILEAMEKFAKEERLQYICCLLLANLSMDSRIRKVIMRHDTQASRLVGAALRSHGTDPKTKKSVKSFLDNMCSK